MHAQQALIQQFKVPIWLNAPIVSEVCTVEKDLKLVTMPPFALLKATFVLQEDLLEQLVQQVKLLQTV